MRSTYWRMVSVRLSTSMSNRRVLKLVSMLISASKATYQYQSKPVLSTIRRPSNKIDSIHLFQKSNVQLESLKKRRNQDRKRNAMLSSTLIKSILVRAKCHQYIAVQTQYQPYHNQIKQNPLTSKEDLINQRKIRNKVRSSTMMMLSREN